MFPEDNEEAETETETVKNSLLKTIYFPKNGQDILYLTDKLPKPSYDKDFSPIVDEKKLSYRAVSETPNLLATNETSSNKGSYKYKKKAKGDLTKRSDGSKVSDSNAGIELPSVRKKTNHPAVHKKNTSSIEKLPEVSKPSGNSPNKLTSVERIASRLEQENKSKPMMNIDKEYIQLQKILDRNQKAHDQDTENVS